MHKLRRYFAGVVKEGRKVRWPSRKEMLVAVGVVLLFTGICAIALAFDDFLITKLLGALDSALNSSDASTTSEATEVINTIGGLM